jgi:hypothetical protein
MKAVLTATIVGGLLKPDEQLPLPDQTRVKLTLETISPPPNAVDAWNALKARIAKWPIHGGGTPLTRDELHERH